MWRDDALAPFLLLRVMQCSAPSSFLDHVISRWQNAASALNSSKYLYAYPQFRSRTRQLKNNRVSTRAWYNNSAIRNRAVGIQLASETIDPLCQRFHSLPLSARAIARGKEGSFTHLGVCILSDVLSSLWCRAAMRKRSEGLNGEFYTDLDVRTRGMVYSFIAPCHPPLLAPKWFYELDVYALFMLFSIIDCDKKG